MINRQSVFIKLLTIVLTISFSSVLLIGCGTKDPIPTASSQSSGNAVQSKSNPEKILQAGETATLNGMEVTLVNTSTPKNVSADGEYKYVVLRYKIKNTGTAALQWDNKNIYWYDSTLGEKKGSIKNTGVKTAVVESGTISPGASEEFEAVYKVSISVSNAEFRYYPSSDASYQAKWKLDIK